MEVFHKATKNADGGGLENLMESMGLGMIAKQVVFAFSYVYSFILKLFKLYDAVLPQPPI